MQDFKFFKKNKKEFPIDDIFVPVRSNHPPISTYIRASGIIENHVNRVVTDSHCESVFNFIKSLWFTDTNIIDRIFNTFGDEDNDYSFAVVNQFDLINPQTFEQLKNIIVFCYINNDLFKLRIEATEDLVDYHKITVLLPTQQDVEQWNSLNS